MTHFELCAEVSSMSTGEDCTSIIGGGCGCGNGNLSRESGSEGGRRMETGKERTIEEAKRAFFEKRREKLGGKEMLD